MQHTQQYGRLVPQTFPAGKTSSNFGVDPTTLLVGGGGGGGGRCISNQSTHKQGSSSSRAANFSPTQARNSDCRTLRKTSMICQDRQPSHFSGSPATVGSLAMRKLVLSPRPAGKGSSSANQRPVQRLKPSSTTGTSPSGQ